MLYPVHRYVWIGAKIHNSPYLILQRTGAYFQAIQLKRREENQMNLNRDFPYVVACYLIAVGLFFIFSDMLGADYLAARPPGKYYLYGLSIIFIAAGIVAVYLKYQGKLRRSDKSITEVRLEAIENLNDTALLANIALEETDSEVQKAAETRLKQISN
jgi:hypothetical protein